MNVNIRKGQGTTTPASIDSEEMVAQIASLMLASGISDLVAQKYVSGMGSRLHVSISPFQGCPGEVVAQGIVIKDALAQILSTANIMGMSITLDQEETEAKRKEWRDVANKVRLMNEGSFASNAESAENSGGDE